MYLFSSFVSNTVGFLWYEMTSRNETPFMALR